MEKNIDFRPFAFFVIALGVILAFAAAVVPHYDAGYTLLLSVLLTGLLPYLVYGLFTDIVRGWTLLIVGALLFGVDIGVKIPERFLHYNGYTDNTIYYTPLVSTLIMIVILAIGARRENRWRGEATTIDAAPHHTEQKTGD